MKFDFSGVPKTQRKREPGSLLGEKRICCSRCGNEFAESELATIPRGAAPGTPRVFVCVSCGGEPDVQEDSG